MLEVGKLYSCSKWCLILYIDRKSLPEDLHPDALHPAAPVSAIIAHMCITLNATISYVDINIPFLVLSTGRRECYEVLVGDKRGWIIYKDWLNIKEITDAAT